MKSHLVVFGADHGWKGKGGGLPQKASPSPLKSEKKI